MNRFFISNTAMKKDLNASFLIFVENYFAPLTTAAKNMDSFRSLFSKIGLDSTYLSENDIQTIQKLFSAAGEFSQLELSNFDDYIAFFKRVNDVLDSLKEIPSILTNIISGENSDIKDILMDLLTHLALRNLYFNYPTVFNLLTIIGAVKYADVKAPAVNTAGQVVRAPYQKLAFDFPKIYQFLFNPVSALKNEYLPSGSVKTSTEALAFSDKLFPQIGYFLSKFNIDFRYGLIDEDCSGFPTDSAFDIARRTLHLTFPPINSGRRFTLSLVLIPENEGGPALRLSAEGSSIDTEYVTPNWFFQTKGSGNLPAIMVGVNGFNIENSIDENYEFQSTVQFLNASDEPVFFFGEENGTRLDIRTLCFDLFFTSRRSNFGLGFSMQKSSLTISPGNGDSFLKKLLPPDGVIIDFDLGLAWSYAHGVTLCGSAGLESEFVINKKIIDLLEIWSIKTSLLGRSESISIGLSMTFNARLGPLSINIKNFGFAAAYGHKNSDFTFNPIMPTGVGLSISSSAITGAGNLDFDQPNQRYSGGLGLQFGEIGLSAFGLIVTKPDEYSLLISICATFNPAIQLGYGFTLNGVGGLIAANRSIDVEKLRGGIKNHTLDGILFPDPNALVDVIGKMESVFPVKDGQYVVGPMVKIGWGANLLTADIGVFIEFPDPVRILLLGQVKAALPKPDKPIVVINLDVIGVVDFAAAELTFQASLYDSKLLTFEICGDSAMLIGWGNNPRFALAIGGFHPRFTPPSPASVFAGLKRMSINIGNAGAVQISCGGYMAITSNTLQFGAKAELFIDADSITVEGYIGFDALFIFSPFAFEVEIYAGVHLKYEGYSLFGLDLHFWLSGPNPWHARGTASIDLWLFSIDVGFDETWGDATPSTIAPVNPWPLLKAELENPDNWGTQLPSKRSMVEILRERKQADSTVKQEVVLHPFGILEIRQRVCPLGKEIQKIANAPVEEYNQFDVVDFKINDEKVINAQFIEEHFAPSQYLELTRDEQFTKPSFDKWIAGVKSSPDMDIHLFGTLTSADLKYEFAIYSESEGTSDYKASPVSWANVEHLHFTQVARRELHRIDPIHRNSPAVQAKYVGGVKFSKRPIAAVQEEQYCLKVMDDTTDPSKGSFYQMEQLKKERQLQDQLENKLAVKYFIIPEYQAL